jgi:hypothetical protein
MFILNQLNFCQKKSQMHLQPQLGRAQPKCNTYVLLCQAQVKLGLAKIGSRRVHALPLAACINVGGHYKWHFFLFLSFSPLSSSLLNLPEGVVIGIQIFPWAPK